MAKTSKNSKTLVYQMYPISWERVIVAPDGHTDGSAMLAMTEHLKRVQALGADYVWLSPIYPSPRHDHGYDISDYRCIDSRLGTLADVGYFVTTAHQLGLKVIFDLVLNHTSTEHPWFWQHPEYYIWNTKNLKGWQNLFDGGPAWKYHKGRKQHYLHLFHEKQADLNWFPDGEHLNQELVDEFRRIVEFWVDLFEIDGFRLDIPQAINKDLSSDTLELSELLYGNKAPKVISEVFKGHKNLFLLMECMDPTFGEVMSYYTASTPVDFVLNMMLKDEIGTGSEANQAHFTELLDKSVKLKRYMLELESHDSPRFSSRPGVTPDDMIWWMFTSGAEGICLYQGQELGLGNPDRDVLPDEKLRSLDAATEMRYQRGTSLDELRPTSRANARVPLPLAEYARQEYSGESYLNLTKAWLRRWKKSGLKS